MRDSYIAALSTMTIRTWELDGVAVVEVTGELDMTSGGSLSAILTVQIERLPAGVIVDLTKVDFFGSAGIHALVEAAALAREHGTVLVVATDKRVVLRPLRITGTNQELLIHPTVDLAVAAIEARRAPSLS